MLVHSMSLLPGCQAICTLPRLLHKIEELLCVHVHIPCTPLDYSEAGPCTSLCRLSLGNRGKGEGNRGRGTEGGGRGGEGRGGEGMSG